MSGGTNRLLAAAVASGALLAALVVPSVASASCNGRPSAENVYSPCLTGGKSSGGGGNTSSPSGSSSGSTPISTPTAKALAHAGKDRRVLSALVRGYGVRRVLAGSNTSSAAEPTALGSAIDLGSGPTVLLIVLAGTAALLLGGSFWRSRHHQ